MDYINSLDQFTFGDCCQARVSDALGRGVANVSVVAFAASNLSAIFSATSRPPHTQFVTQTFPRMVNVGMGRALSGGDVPKHTILQVLSSVIPGCERDEA